MAICTSRGPLASATVPRRGVLGVDLFAVEGVVGNLQHSVDAVLVPERDEPESSASLENRT